LKIEHNLTALMQNFEAFLEGFSTAANKNYRLFNEFVKRIISF